MAVKKKTVKKKAAKKSKKAKKRGQGRPKVIVDWAEVQGYLHAQCTGTQIADLLGIHADTLYNACMRDHKVVFSVYSRQKKDSGVAMVKANHFRHAMSDSMSALIFFLKNYAGLADKPEPDKSDNKGTIMQLLNTSMEKK